MAAACAGNRPRALPALHHCSTVHCLIRRYTHSLVSILKNPDNIKKARGQIKTNKGPLPRNSGSLPPFLSLPLPLPSPLKFCRMNFDASHSLCGVCLLECNANGVVK